MDDDHQVPEDSSPILETLPRQIITHGRGLKVQELEPCATPWRHTQEEESRIRLMRAGDDQLMTADERLQLSLGYREWAKQKRGESAETMWQQEPCLTPWRHAKTKEEYLGLMRIAEYRLLSSKEKTLLRTDKRQPQVRLGAGPPLPNFFQTAAGQSSKLPDSATALLGGDASSVFQPLDYEGPNNADQSWHADATQAQEPQAQVTSGEVADPEVKAGLDEIRERNRYITPMLQSPADLEPTAVPAAAAEAAKTEKRIDGLLGGEASAVCRPSRSRLQALVEQAEEAGMRRAREIRESARSCRVTHSGIPEELDQVQARTLNDVLKTQPPPSPDTADPAAEERGR